MKNIAIIFAMVISLGVFGQGSLRDMGVHQNYNRIVSGDGLPKANEIVLEAAKSRIGERVKTGICFDLVAYSLSMANPNWDKRCSGKYIYGKRIKQKNILPGDIVVYDGCVFKDGLVVRSHIAIVYFVTDEDKDNIELIEQNVGAKTLKESKVIVDEVNFSSENLIKGRLEFYRPY